MGSAGLTWDGAGRVDDAEDGAGVLGGEVGGVGDHGDVVEGRGEEAHGGEEEGRAEGLALTCVVSGSIGSRGVKWCGGNEKERKRKVGNKIR